MASILHHSEVPWYVVSSGGVQTDPEKVPCVLDWPVLSTRKQLRQLLSLASYYRRFVHNVAQIPAPLNRMLDKGRQWHCAQKRLML